MPALHQRQQFGGGPRIDRGEGLIEQNKTGVLGNEACEQHALHLPAGKRADRAPLEPGQPDRCNGRFDGMMILSRDAAQHPAAAPQSHCHHVVNADRKRTVDIGHLRQVGDAAAIDFITLDRARERLERAGDCLEQGRLAGAVGADHREQRAVIHDSVEMMHRRMAVIAQREILQSQLRHRFAPRSADRPPERRP